MKTNLLELKKYYEEKLVGGIYENLSVEVSLNNKKENSGMAAITFKISASEDKTIDASIYIVEGNNDNKTLIFVNDASNDLIFANTSRNAIEKSKRYVEVYLERSARKISGLEIQE